MLKVKVTAVGNSMGILLPKEALHKLKAERGDTLYLVEGPEGYTLTPYEPDFEQQVEAGALFFGQPIPAHAVGRRRLRPFHHDSFMTKAPAHKPLIEWAALRPPARPDGGKAR